MKLGDVGASDVLDLHFPNGWFNLCAYGIAIALSAAGLLFYLRVFKEVPVTQFRNGRGPYVRLPFSHGIEAIARSDVETARFVPCLVAGDDSVAPNGWLSLCAIAHLQLDEVRPISGGINAQSKARDIGIEVGSSRCGFDRTLSEFHDSHHSPRRERVGCDGTIK
ncbi:hypothetical protein J2848_003833 [Azospirillum lipoferum]|nr:MULTISPECIES: hypothetical protein [Azospirillum]MCP1612153.1 hypothetical protein [Azospirillum lipoferum]MDW5536625.1 hypothetical protein [Azospirillum sp. NL1]